MTSTRHLLSALAVAFLFALLSGCAPRVEYAVDREFTVVRPKTVAIAPVKWSAEATGDSPGIAGYFRAMSAERLKRLNYAVAPIDEVDRVYAADTGLAGAAPDEAARALGVDTVLYIEVTEWDADMFLTYASLSIKAGFDLYSATGAKLWSASYGTSEADFALDRESVELAVLKIYEPRVQRFVDAVFSTLPPNEARVEKRRYFDWLP